MTYRPLLSVCIPTYNRAGYLRECLSSIETKGIDSLVEVVVSDNASTDDTLSVLKDFANRLPLRWVVQAENVGPDRNFDAVVHAANGEYCWLLGSDDIVEAGALQTIVQTLRSHQPDILHFGYVQGDIDLNRLSKAHPHASRTSVSPGDLANYFERMANMSLLFTFMSSFIFRRSVWTNRSELQRKWMGTFYVQALTMHHALAAGASLVSLDQCMVVARGGNPNEINSVPGKFVSLDARTLALLVSDIYADDKRYWHALGAPFRRSYPIKALVYTAANGGLQYVMDNRDVLVRLGHPTSIFTALTTLNRLRLLWLVKVLIKLRRNTLTIASRD
jgi:abequosyltransferase